MSTHPTELTLRRLHAGELAAEQTRLARAHLGTCPECRDVVRRADEAQARFEARLPFPRFAAAVEARARTRVPAPARGRPRLMPLLALAAALALTLALVPLTREGTGNNRLKGGARVELRVGGAGAQHVATPGAEQRLAPGERVRLGLAALAHPYVLALSVDADGAVTPLYPERGESLRLAPGTGMQYLPGSLEFTGAGAERVVVLVSERPLAVDAALGAARAAYEGAGRDVRRMGDLALPGEQTHWVLLKP